MATTGDRDDVFRGFLKLCQGMRAPKTKNTPSASSYVEKLQTFLSDDHSRQLVHRWRQWGYLLNSLLHVVKEEMGTYLNLGKSRKRKMGSKPKVPQLRYWHYLRTELQAAHVEADGPFLHLDPNGRDCISQLFSFCNIVVDRESTEYDRDVEIRVEKEAWLTVEELAQYRVYCAILERTQWTNALEVAMGSFTESSDLISDHATAPTRARVVRLLLRNCTFDVIELLPEIIQDVGDWFKEAKATAIDEQGDNADSLLLVVASSLIEMLSDLIRSHFSSIGPLMLKNGIAVLQFIAQSNKGRKNGLRGAPADFIVQFLELYRYNADGVPYFKYLAPITLLRELASLNQIVLSADEMNLMTSSFTTTVSYRNAPKAI
ncbi:hypothetical protein PHYBOEH_008270 [Phytophthora boehmeriae]|uniref:Uncharacterized protein n=1 Tax=Phytophthora boehmeriae TaxID=109152 RepID=A0A8T1W1W6_9STRA|nr:hypothetical protein PHYBOEH_008270 [Phytophthora boehmeriae]